MRPLRFLFPIALVLIPLLSTPADAQTRPAESASEKEKLTYFKKILWRKAYREQDTKLLDRLLAKEFQFLRPDGRVTTKNDELEYIKENKPTYDSFEYTIQRLDIFENGTAIIAGKGHVKGTDEKGAYQYTYYSSNILIKRHGRWKAVGSHVSGYKRTYLSKSK